MQSTVTAAEAARLTGIAPGAIITAMRSGTLKGRQIGDGKRKIAEIALSDLQLYVNARVTTLRAHLRKHEAAARAISARMAEAAA